jgi:hypothetical protein
MTDWQPIETAPKDGRKILLLEPFEYKDDYSECLSIGFWGSGYLKNPKRWCNWHDSGDHYCDYFASVYNPTHWAELPEPPK